jgi:plasmid maintenance system killer protein
LTPPKLEKLLCSESKLRKKYGSSIQLEVSLRLQELYFADCLEDLRHSGGAYHQLFGDRKGQIAASCGKKMRLILKPVSNSQLNKPDGSLDWTLVKSIQIIDLIDYH